MDFLLAGKPAEAERCYRAALDMGAKVPESDRVRLMVCLGDALMDQGRYDEAKQCLAQALELGDPTGSGQDSMCDVLLAQKASPEKAIEMADEGMRLWERGSISQSFGARWAATSKDLFEAKTWARKARALLILDRRAEARQAMDRALRILDMSKSELQTAKPTSSLLGRLILGDRLRRMRDLTISATYWRIGLSLQAMGDTNKAAEQFVIVRDTDRMGKYRSLAQKELDSLGYMRASSR
ncbi:MAG: tetratricopeptide repeat protein [Terracidiphilus sp.]|jgi:tetratricopeptide (TPR) repeat protein